MKIVESKTTTIQATAADITITSDGDGIAVTIKEHDKGRGRGACATVKITPDDMVAFSDAINKVASTFVDVIGSAARSAALARGRVGRVEVSGAGVLADVSFSGVDAEALNRLVKTMNDDISPGFNVPSALDLLKMDMTYRTQPAPEGWHERRLEMYRKLSPEERVDKMDDLRNAAISVHGYFNDVSAAYDALSDDERAELKAESDEWLDAPLVDDIDEQPYTELEMAQQDVARLGADLDALKDEHRSHLQYILAALEEGSFNDTQRITEAKRSIKTRLHNL